MSKRRVVRAKTAVTAEAVPKRRWRLNKEQIQAISTYLLGLSGVASVGGAVNWWLLLFSPGKDWREAGVLTMSAAVLFFMGLWLLRTPKGGAK